jgi:hypothetical protein
MLPDRLAAVVEELVDLPREPRPVPTRSVRPCPEAVIRKRHA